MSKIKNKYKNYFYEEKNNTSLVGVIWMFIILVSFIWNTNNLNSSLYKANLMESTKKIEYKKTIETLTIWRQNVIINWQ